MYYFDDFFELAVVVAALYGIFCLIRKGYQKFQSIDESKKRDFFKAMKVLLFGIVGSLVIYLSPAINESIKIAISLIITLAGIASVFSLDEFDKNDIGIRMIILFGQMFFGITMFLLMINTNLGYSSFSIFTIWTIFNFIIMLICKKLENKFMFGLTLTGAILFALVRYGNGVEISEFMSCIILCILLIVLQLFKSESVVRKVLQNVFLTILVLIVIRLDDSVLTSVITLILLVAIFLLILLRVGMQGINLKVFLVYLPLAVILLLSGFEGDFFVIVALFNIMTVALLQSDKSLYKKLFVVVTMLVTVLNILNGMYFDGLYNLIILASVAITFIYVFEPKKMVKVEKGDNEDEE